MFAYANGQGATTTCTDGVCPHLTVALYSCVGGSSFNTGPSIRGAFKTSECFNGQWAAFSPCVEVPPARSWVISNTSSSCIAACDANGMDCTVQDMAGITDASKLNNALQAAVPFLTCTGTPLAVAAAAGPAFDIQPNSCAYGSASSSCAAVPASGRRFCHCRMKCPAHPPPPEGTLVKFLYEGAEVQCLGAACKSNTVARYSCVGGYAFSNQLTVRGGYQTATCDNGVWAGTPSPCVVSVGLSAAGKSWLTRFY